MTSPVVATITLNPALDLHLSVPEVSFDTVLRATGHRRVAGGKGINVSRSLAREGVPALTVLFAGGPTGHEMADLARMHGLEVEVVDVGENTRINVHLEEESTERTIKVNMPGPAVPVEVDPFLVSRLKEAHESLAAVVLAGALPPGARSESWRVLIDNARNSGVTTLLDTSGSGLRSALRARPDVVKINRAELAELLDKPVDSREAVAAEATALQETGIACVCITLSEGGAILVDETGVHDAQSDRIAHHRVVGAGDAFMGGLTAAWVQGLRGAELLERAMVAGVDWALQYDD